MGRNNLLLWLFGFAACFLASGVVALEGEGIVGGDEAAPAQFKYQISLQVGGQSICGGGIIGDQHILTAAHCIIDEKGSFRTYPYKVTAGINDVNRKDENAVTVAVEKMYVPREYLLSGRTTGDIAVLKLVSPLGVKSNSRLSKLQLPKDNKKTFAGEKAIISGFGWDWVKVTNHPIQGPVEKGGSEGKMRFAETNVLSTAQCQRNYPYLIDDNQICARVEQRYINGKKEGVCSGDSGGPLVFGGKVVIGTVSTSPIGCQESIAAGVYTRVSAYLKFIDNAMNDVSSYDIRTHTLVRSRQPVASNRFPSIWSMFNFK